MSERLTDADRATQNARRRRAWDKQAEGYDKQITWFERRVLGEENREWACSRAQGAVLEVAIGTGLNLPFYGTNAKVSGIDLSPAMLEIARKRAAELGREVNLREGDAHDLPFANSTFDTVVSTYSLCNIPDVGRAVGEMKRVLKDGGRLILVDHIRSENRLVLSFQKIIEFVSKRVDGDHMTRRPLEQVTEQGFEIRERDRFRLGGIVERVSAVKLKGSG
jgi:ubiquinone/menaquinone biosynthesis C-methylase UbiE